MKKILLLLSLVLLGTGAFSQEFTVNFTGRLNDSQYQRLDSVRITDVTRGWTETLVYPDTVIVVNATVNVSNIEYATGFEQNVPNPFDCHTMVDLAVTQDQNVLLQLYDAAGKQCADLNVALNAGSHRFEITASKPQTYILKAMVGTKTYSVRMLNVGSCGGDGIRYNGYVGMNVKLTVENEFQVGDNMEYVGYANIGGNVVESETVTLQLRETSDVVLDFWAEISGSIAGQINGHDWVDLGLPSGLLWATCNVGATNHTDYGNYYAWGETAPKEIYSWDTYRYCNGSQTTLTKYCNNANFGYNGFTDELTTLDASDDAATANWGSVWRMPTFDEFNELITNCTVTYLDYPEYEVPGRLFVGPNGNSIFLPLASEHSDNDMFNPVPAHYWSSSLYTGIPICAWQLYFDPDTSFMHYSGYRSYGRTVRPVCNREIVDSLPTVITGTASDITASRATISGYLFSDGGAGVVCGVMFGTSANNLTQCIYSSSGIGEFTVNLTGLMYSTIYYYRAFAINRTGTVYGEVKQFTTSESAGSLNEHSYIDLGLPSGTLWSTCNVGASNPEDYGDYYAWGETIPKMVYSNGSYTYTDHPVTLPSSADAATVNWGAGWRIPTNEELEELLTDCTVIWTTQNGVNGRLFTGPNGNSIFLPAAGWRSGSSLNDADSSGFYWTSSSYSTKSFYVKRLYFDSDNCYIYGGGGYMGFSVRAVCIQQN